MLYCNKQKQQGEEFLLVAMLVGKKIIKEHRKVGSIVTHEIPQPIRITSFIRKRV